MRCEGCGTDFVEGAAFCFKCGSPRPRQEAGDPLIGQTIGNYRIIAALGEGAMGRVYRAEQVNLGRPVCIKTLLPHISGEASLVQRFEREAKAVSALHHPNIVSVFDFGRMPDGALYYAMELVEGRSLRKLIEQDAPLALPRAFGIIEQILSGLEEAHCAGVVHRDLKPENVLIGKLRDGSDLAKVLDFGIAKVVSPEGGGDVRLTGTGMVCGTPGYMAPEQITGGDLDRRADVYAAGVVLFEMLTGRPPFGGSTLQELLRAHLTGTAPAPSTVSRTPLPPQLDLVVLRALANQRDRRFHSALEFKSALENVKLGIRQSVSAASMPAPARQIICPRCGGAEAADRKFCGNCGGPLSASAAASAANAQALSVPGQPAVDQSMSSLQKLMPQRLLDHLGDLSQALAGERRNVSVLFADISGFTSMSEHMDPEDVRQVMNRCFDGMVQAVNRYDGTVDKFIGDCIMALFGAPKAHEDDPERAVRCALEMQAWLQQVNKTLAKPLGVRIGINCGEVVAGAVGGQGRMDYTVMGDVVNTAQRLESASKVGGVLVSRSVRDAAARAANFREVEPIRLKGKEKPVQAFEVVGLKDESARSASPLVGRGQELEALKAALRAARSGKAAAALVLGDAGMGKTRLLDEAARLASSAGFAVCRARAGRYGQAAPLELVRSGVFSLCGGIPKAPSEADVKLATLHRLGINASEIKRLQHLFGTAPAMPGFEREEAQRLDRAAVLDVFARACTKTGLCLVADDLHLADSSSLELLGEMLQRFASLPLAVLAAARPGDTSRLLPGAPRLELGPLSNAEIVQLAEAQLRSADLSREAKEAIVERAEGNPYFAQEVIRALVDANALELSGGAWRATASLSRMTIPETLLLAVSARLDALSAPARQLLRAGAVVGRVFSLEQVGPAIDPPIDVAAASGECQNRGFLSPSEQPPGGLQFVQSAVHEAVLKSLTKADLKHTHLRIAETIERGVNFGEEHPTDQLARHFLAAEQSRKACRYLTLAGERLVERSDFPGAAERFKQALALVQKEVRGIPPAEQATQLLQLAAKAAGAEQAAGGERALSLLDPVLEQVPKDRALVARAEALRQRGLALTKMSRLREAVEAFNEALSVSAGQAGPELLAGINADLAAALEARGELPQATDRLTEGLRAVAGVANAEKDLMWRFLNQLGRIHLKLRQVDRAEEFFQNARQNAAHAASPLGESKAVANLASVMSSKGDHAGALNLMGEALELAEKAGDPLGVARIHYNAGRLLVAIGQRAEGAARLEKARKMSVDLGWREGLAAAAQALDALRAQGVR